MRKTAILLATLAICLNSAAQALPSGFKVEYRSRDHVQGVAIDTAAHCFYLSFTTSLVKTDYEGNVLASIDSINGHLGGMTFDAASRRLYASLECKDDEIGRGIARHLGVEAYTQAESRFYIAAVDVDRMEISRYEVAEVLRDYKTRYGCSGIDGVTIAPQIGKKHGKPRLYVAYGIYSDISRRDNDHQILLEFKLRNFRKGVSAPKPSAKYFIYTGNTSWGVQNLCYDACTGCIFMASYAGKKPDFPNYRLFAVPVAQKPVKKVLKGLEGDGRHLSLALWQQGSVEGVRGWRFGDASTGFCNLGNGTWYVSTPKKLGGGWQTAKVRRWQWNGGKGEVPFD